MTVVIPISHEHRGSARPVWLIGRVVNNILGRMWKEAAAACFILDFYRGSEKTRKTPDSVFPGLDLNSSPLDISNHYSGHFTPLERTFSSTTAVISHHYSRHFTAALQENHRFSVLEVLTPKIKFFVIFTQSFHSLKMYIFQFLPSSLLNHPTWYLQSIHTAYKLRPNSPFRFCAVIIYCAAEVYLLCAVSLMNIHGSNMQPTWAKYMLTDITCIGCVWLNFVYLRLIKKTQ